jgi:hypothetical protein
MKSSVPTLVFYANDTIQDLLSGEKRNGDQNCSDVQRKKEMTIQNVLYLKQRLTYQ